jgi:type II secretory pathway pseudopilin PulG
MNADFRERLGDEAGISLVELLVVMVVLTVIMLGLTTSFVSGMRSEVAVSQRQQAQENARFALSRMREDIHCANAIGTVFPNAYGGFTLSLPETTNVCPNVVSSANPADSSEVALQWCTIPDPARPGLFQLYRKGGTCDGVNSSLFVEFIAPPAGGWPSNASTVATAWDGNIWPTSTCPSGLVPTLAVDLKVNAIPAGRGLQDYELNHRIALRNADRCT